MTREEMMQPWVEAPCPNNVPKIIEYGIEVVCISGKLSMDGQGHLPDETCGGTGLDPRFDALRCKHERSTGSILGMECCDCDTEWVPIGEVLSNEIRPMGLRTDLGALVRVAAACGFQVRLSPPDYPWTIDHEARLGRRKSSGYTSWEVPGHGETDEDALAQALVAALGKP